MAKEEYIERHSLMRKVHTGMNIIEAMQAIVDEPTADVVEVRHGRWIDSEEDGHLSICGVCNYPVDRFYKTKYCPNCGAKMTEDHHEQKE